VEFDNVGVPTQQLQKVDFPQSDFGELKISQIFNPALTPSRSSPNFSFFKATNLFRFTSFASQTSP